MLLFLIAVHRFGGEEPLTFSTLCVAVVGGIVFPTLYSAIALLRGCADFGKLYVLAPPSTEQTMNFFYLSAGWVRDQDDPTLYKNRMTKNGDTSLLDAPTLTYFGRVRFKGHLPGGMVAVALGTLLAWTTGLAPGAATPPQASFHVPVPVLGDLIDALRGGHIVPYLSVIIAMGLFNVLGSLQNIESAEAAGDLYETRPSLMINGVGSVVAALFGSVFPTTIYIGHPGWKALGARAGYSILNGAFVTIICVTGTLAWISWAVPIDAGMAIVLWIGIVISAQAFEATPRHHAAAVVVGLLPGIGAWGALMAKNGLRAAGMGTEARPFTDALVPEFLKNDVWIHGVFSLEQGFLFTSMLLSAAVVGVIERRWNAAAAWCALASVISATGLMHSYQWTPADTVLRLSPAWPFATAYAAMAVLFFSARWITEPYEGH